MRNDARPIGEDAHNQSPLDSRQSPDDRDQPLDDDARESVTHDRQSHVVNREAEEIARQPDADIDPVMPTGDSTLTTKI